VVVLCVGVQADDTESDRKYNLNVYWADTPPVLDGSMDDACWQDAEAIDKFAVYYSDPLRHATRQTEVRACYDAGSLYLFFTMHQEEMDEVVLGRPEDYRNQNVLQICRWAGLRNDAIEFFLNQRHPPVEGRTFHFRANAHGARWEEPVNASAREWKPDWKIVVDHSQPGRWTAEVAIPFSELRFTDGDKTEENRRYKANITYADTPVDGDVWRAQFFRYQAGLPETSHWSLTPSSPSHGYYFGFMRFRGRKDGSELPKVMVEKQPSVDKFGDAEMELAVSPADGVEAEFFLFNDGEQVNNGVLDIDNGHLNLSYRINNGGDWILQVDMTRQGDLFYRGVSGAKLPPIGSVADDILHKTEKIREFIRPVSEPRIQTVLEEVTGLETAAIALNERLKESDSWSDEDWQQAIDQADELSGEIENLDFHLYRLKLLDDLDHLPGFVAVVADSDTKIYPQEGLLINTGMPAAQLEAAGNMYESFQVALIPFWESNEAVEVEFSDLTGEKGTIASGNLSYRIVDYVKMKDSTLASLDGIREYEPDVLRSAYAFDLQPDRIATLWVDVHCPEGTAEGEYAGTMRISAGSEMAEVGIQLYAYGFDIPAKATLKNNHWFNIGTSFGLLRYYKDISHSDYTINDYREHLKLGKKYRITIFPDDYGFKMCSDMLPIRRLADGSLDYDFSIWEDWYELGFEYGGNLIRASGGCNGAVFRPFINPSSLKVVSEEDGKTYTFGELYPEWYEMLRQRRKDGTWRPEHMFEHPGLRQYLRQWTDFLDRKGWLAENVHYEIQDEKPPYDVIMWHRLLRELIPEMPLLSYAARPEKVKDNLRYYGYIDIWAPGLYAFDNEDYVRAMRERYANYGERTSFYVCSGWGWHAPYTSTRVLPWAAFQHDVHHFLHFMAANFSIPKDEISRDPDERYPAVPLPGSFQQYNLVWPGPDMDLYPSIRLSSMRDGMQDYEVLTILKDRCRYMVPEVPLHLELLQEAEALLDLDELFAGLTYQSGFPPDSGGRGWQYIGKKVNLAEHRGKVARLIQKMNDAIKAYPEVLSEQDE